VENKWKLLFSSRKFWAAILGLVLMVAKTFKPDLPLQAEELAGVMAILSAYILGTAVEDGLRHSN
jgi:uncharacterized membrane protein